MKRFLLFCVSAAVIPGASVAQPSMPAPATNHVQLDVLATGEVTRVPDRVTISAGVTTRAPQAQAALRENAERMERVRAALARAGIAPRDIQTGNISLGQDYRPSPEGEARPVGFVASNQLNIRFRDIARAGPIIDALVAEGANSINGPSLDIADPEPARNEARTRAVARQRAELYARAINSRVRRIVAISEAGAVESFHPPAIVRAEPMSASTTVEPGEQSITASVTVTFELDAPGR